MSKYFEVLQRAGRDEELIPPASRPAPRAEPQALPARSRQPQHDFSAAAHPPRTDAELRKSTATFLAVLIRYMLRVFELTQWPGGGKSCPPAFCMQEHRKKDVPPKRGHTLADEVYLYQLALEISACLGIRAEIGALIKQYDRGPAAAGGAGKKERKVIEQAASEVESSRGGTFASTQEGIRELPAELIGAAIPPAVRLVSSVISAAAAELQVLPARSRQPQHDFSAAAHPPRTDARVELPRPVVRRDPAVVQHAPPGKVQTSKKVEPYDQRASKTTGGAGKLARHVAPIPPRKGARRPFPAHGANLERRRARRAIVYFASLFLFCCGPMIGALRLWTTGQNQNTRTLRGVVEDSSGDPVLGAQVELQNKTTHELFETASDETGRFEFVNLLSGEYTITVRVEGFRDAQVSVSVAAGPAAPLRFRLDLAEVKNEVTVTANPFTAPTAEQNNDVIELTGARLLSLPTSGDLLAVPSLFLDPGALGVGGAKIIVDGVEGSALEVPMSSVRRVYVNKNPYSSEFGRPGKGRIEVTTRRGALEEYHGNLSLLARSATASPLRWRTIAEAQIDGPLVRKSKEDGPLYGNHARNVSEKATFLLSGRSYLSNGDREISAVTPAGPLVEKFLAPERNTNLFGRLDFRPKAGHRLALHYRYKNKLQREQGVEGVNLPEHGTNFFDHEHEVKALETATLSPTLLNEIRFAFKKQTQQTSSVVDQTAILVLDTFNAGGAQVSLRRRETSVDLQDLVTLIKGRHSFRFGGGIRPRFYGVRDASNFGGTFTFSSLATFLAGRPFLFAINEGDPNVSFKQHESYGFFQDEMQLRPNLSLLLGVHHEMQSNLDRYNNFAPRLAFAYSPRSGQTVLRGGVGVFYERQPEIMERQNLLYNGVRVREIVVPDPAFAMLTPDLMIDMRTLSVVRIAPDIRSPYMIQASLSVERKLGRGQNHLALEYMITRGKNLYRLRNINAPLPGTGLRPDPNFIDIDQFESSGASRGQSLTATFQARLRNRLDLLGQYTLSRNTDDTGGIFSLPANNYDLSGERGRADFDRRHRLNLITIYTLPWDFHLSGIANFWSGLPYNITTGFDDNHDTVANDRPPGVTRNTGHGPAYANVDARLAKRFRLQKKDPGTQFDLGLDVFNLFNRRNAKNFVGTRTSPFFGHANTVYTARRLQLSLRLHF